MIISVLMKGQPRKCYLLIEYAGARGSAAAQIAVLHCENAATSAPDRAYADAYRTSAPDLARRSAEDPSLGSAVARVHLQDGDCLRSIDWCDYPGWEVYLTSKLVHGGGAQQI